MFQMFVFNCISGRDGSKSFITGNFEPNDDDDVLTLKPSEIQSLVQWAQFYETRYRFVGYLADKFYDASGRETEYLRQVHEQVAVAVKIQAESDMLKIEFPPCNVEWTAEAHTRVWCTRESGGAARGWVGVPRKYFQAGVADWRCACVDDANLSAASVKEFDGCDRLATSCTYNADD